MILAELIQNYPTKGILSRHLLYWEIQNTLLSYGQTHPQRTQDD